ncbi:MAG: HDOD domain-containing protein [Candidatus Accumulibacter sp.]|jgi:EAL and modified HD-GYP domain-containing signal transduction protein|nr:HDOD domain-containing protein [Accumulibacter sp.]
MPDIFISHQPLINRQNRILANRLNLHLLNGATPRDAAGALRSLAADWPVDGKPVFINCGETPWDRGLLEWNAPSNVTFELPGAAFAAPDAANLVSTLQSTQAALCLMIDEHAETAFSSGVAFRFIGLDAKRFPPPRMKSLAAQTQPHGIGVAFNVPDRQGFQDCLNAGLNAAASWFFKQSSGAQAKAINPAQAQIIQIMNLVRKNAEIREIETALKQDVTLSYKLLRYINSAGFGLSCEIQSFRHAVSILGYDKLNKWLSLLLATASKDPAAQAQMHTALYRARLMEILGQGLVDRNEYDNLFITGAFSMLETLLGLPTGKVLETMSLPETICDALLGRGGVYGPFLDLAIACEGEDGEAIATQAGMLGLSSDTFNQAQMKALSFAETIQF